MAYRKRIIRALLLLFLPLQLIGLERQPWFSDVYEFHFLGGYTYSYYSKVNHAINQLTSTSNDHLLSFGLEFSPDPNWSIDGDLEFVQTPRQHFGFRSIGVQGRYLWKDDIIGDPVSFTTGFNFRFTSPRSLKDVSCPHHANADFQFNFALGKELDYFRFWRYRIWGFGEIGFANAGSPWFEGLFSLEGNYDDLHKWAAFLYGGHGYGRNSFVDINRFRGYGKIRYKFVDVGARYGYRLNVWGSLRFEYVRRVFAKAYPEHVNFFTFSYLLPFSF